MIRIGFARENQNPISDKVAEVLGKKFGMGCKTEVTVISPDVKNWTKAKFDFDVVVGRFTEESLNELKMNAWAERLDVYILEQDNKTWTKYKH